MTELSIYKSVLITSPIGFDILFINVETTLKQSRYKVVSTLFQRCFERRIPTLYQRFTALKMFFFFNDIAISTNIDIK